MHVAGHKHVHVHQDGTRHVHGAKPKAKHVHKDGTTHNHKTGEHKHADGQVHQHKTEAKSKLGLDKMECCPTDGAKMACCPNCGNATCTCCDMKGEKPAEPTKLEGRPLVKAESTSSLPKTLATVGAGLVFPPLGIGILGARLWNWLKDNY